MNNVANKEFREELIKFKIFLKEERIAIINDDAIDLFIEQNSLDKSDKSKEMTVDTVTNCPTCGMECTIGGKGTSEGSTHYYIPKIKEDKKEEKPDIWVPKNVTQEIYMQECDSLREMLSDLSGLNKLEHISKHLNAINEKIKGKNQG